MFLKEIDEIVEEQKGKVKLVVVCLAEAHPKDGWHSWVNDKQEVSSLLPSLYPRVKIIILFNLRSRYNQQCAPTTVPPQLLPTVQVTGSNVFQSKMSESTFC